VSIARKQDPRVPSRARVGREHAHAGAKRRLGGAKDRLTLFPQTPEVLERIARLLVGGGESPETLSRRFAAACHRVRPHRNLRRRTAAAPLEYAHVISRWYSDPEYLDSSGVPRPLPLSGRRLSLTSLVAKALPRAKASEVASTLERLGAVRQENRRYRPTERYVYFGQQQEDTVAWLLTVLPGVLSSVEHNAYTRASSRLLGRAAINPYFPVRDLPRFHVRLSKHSIAFLKAVDGDMQRKELRRRTEPTTQLGVVVIAYEDPLVTGQTLRQNTSASKKGPRPPVSQKARS
jgi:hypothetical protein